MDTPNPARYMHKGRDDLRPKLPLLAVVTCAVVALTALVGATDTARADFNPTYEITVADTAAGANSDWQFEFNVPEGDVNFGGAVFFIPSEWIITPGDEIPIGAVMATVNAQATLGLINGACDSVLPVEFIMQNASIDISDTVSYLDTNPEPGEPGYDPSDPGNAKADYAEDRDGSGLQDGIEKYPDFITRAIVDEDDKPQQPIRRAAGITVVAGVDVLLQFLIFEPGTFIDEDIPNDPELGYPSVTTLQNGGDPDFDPIPSAITDFCTPLTTSIVSFGVSKDNECTAADLEKVDPICEVQSALVPGAGGTDPDESGVALFTNPAEGTYTFTTIAAGQRDADGDGYENTLDTCAFEPNVGSPRVKGEGDEDLDGLDEICDPNSVAATGGTNSDEDLDGYTNRQDNCPLDANGENETNQRDTDDDNVGDACDPNPDDPDTEGELLFGRVEQEVTVTPGSPSSQTPTASPTPSGDGDDDGGSSVLIIVIVVIAAVVVVGGGAFYFIRRGGGGRAQS